MSHIDPERLALFALGEPVSAHQDAEHLADCGECVDELTALRHAAVAGRATMDVGELESPPEAVWTRIAAELSLGAGSIDHEPEPEPATAAAAEATSAPEPESEPAGNPRRRLWGAWALAASFVLIAGLGLGVWAYNQNAGLSEVAEAALAPFPDHPDADGTAVVEERSDGSFEVRVAVNADAPPDTFREVWLITADASALVSLGVLEGAQQTFAIPKDIDLKDYVLVDVSQEPIDGDPSHSGDSIVRGELTFL